jgi:hypothetical protein
VVSASNAKWKLIVAPGSVEGVATTTPFDREGADHVTIVLFVGAPVGGPFQALKVQQSDGMDRSGQLVNPTDVSGCVVGTSMPYSGSAALPDPADAGKVWTFELDCRAPRKKYLGLHITTGGATPLCAVACLSRVARPATDTQSRGVAAVYKA